LNSSVWQSVVSAESVASNSIKLQYLSVDLRGNLYYQVRKPSEKGRTSILKEGRDLLPKEISIGTRVHEYGGVSYLVFEDKVIFSKGDDQGLYLLDKGEISLVVQNSSMRYADGDYDRLHKHLYFVREDKSACKSSIVCIDPILKTEEIAIEGHSFYASPRVSKDGKFLAFIAWDDPNMPWDSSYLYLYKINDDGSLSDGIKIAGDKNISCLEPKWSENNTLFFIDDRTGYWNIYCYRDDKMTSVCELEAEFGYPQWVFGLKTYAVTEKNEIIATYVKDQKHCLSLFREGKLEEIKTNYVSFDDLVIFKDTLYFVGGLVDSSPELVKMDLDTFKTEILFKTSENTIDPDYLSTPEELAFLGEDGEKVYGYFYSPKNPNYQADKPPVILRIHGGPTAKAMPLLNLEVQYWTSRGFAFADVNYRGSSGFGRAYREKLFGKWGQLDVKDAISCIKHLSTMGKIDPAKAIIKGRSSGGFSVFSAIMNSDTFAIGSSYYGIGDLEAMAKDTHRFEKHYFDRLIAPYPKEKEEYIKRSPVSHAEKLRTPLVLFHGKEDRVVPIDQTEKIYQILLEDKVPVSFTSFEGEGHGFRKGETICRALQIELYFFAKLLNLTLNEKMDASQIDNLQEPK